MGRALISHLSTNDINKSLVGNGGERDGASAESEVQNPLGCYGAEPYQKLSSVPRPNYVFCIIGKKRQRQARKVNKVCHTANRSHLLS